jgi:hypothetical protein
LEIILEVYIMARKSMRRRSRKRVRRRASRKVRRAGAPLGISTARSRKITERQDGKKRVDAFFQKAKKHESEAAARARVNAFWKNAEEHEAVAAPTKKELLAATLLQAMQRGRESRKSTSKSSLPPLTRWGKKSRTRWADMA